MRYAWLVMLIPLLMLAVATWTACAAPAEVVITSFEQGQSWAAWSGGTVIAKQASVGTRAYLVPAVLAAGGDWSRFRHLKFDVYNPGRVVSMNMRATDTQGRSITAWEYSVYAGRTTQHVRIDGLRNDFGIGEGIDAAKVARVEVSFGKRFRDDPCGEGLYLDNVRLSTRPTDPYRVFVGGAPAGDSEAAKPAGFYLPEFPGFEAGYHTWAIDPAAYQLLSPPGSGHDGKGRALEFVPLDVNSIKIWDAPRTFERAGTYVVSYWVKGPTGATFSDSVSGRTLPLSPTWQRVQYELTVAAGQTRRFVLDMSHLRGKSAWLDDLTVCLKGATGDLEPVSKATGKPTVVTWSDGICYVNGKPSFIMGFMRANPERLHGSPFNFAFPGELTQPEMSYLDRCAELGLLTSVNLTPALRALAPESAARFARKYKHHPALFSYYLADEPNHGSPSAVAEAPVLARATEILHQLDPNHPTQTTIIPWNSSAVYRFRDAADISGGDEYEVKGTKDNDALWQVWRANEAFHRSARDGEPNIFIPLASSEITREENWAQAYMCVVGGAGGILWFEYGGAQAKWNDFLELGRELRGIEEFLVGVELEKGLTFAGDNGQVKGIGRAAATQTALITVNLKPTALTQVRITAPFLAHATQAEVKFENRTVPVLNGVIVDDFAGLARHVYVVDGVPAGVTPRPVPTPGGAHVSEAGQAWRLDTGGPVTGRSQADVERDAYMAREGGRAEAALGRGDKAAARAVYEEMLRRYPDAQDIRERLRSM